MAGIDATIPAAFLALLWPRLLDSTQRAVALLGAITALLLSPIVPPGVPLKAAGPLVLGGDRALPPFLERLALLLPAPLPAALVATSTFVDDQRWILDARVAGLVVAAFALWRRLPFVIVVVPAAAATAATRAIT